MKKAALVIISILSICVLAVLCYIAYNLHYYNVMPSQSIQNIFNNITTNNNR